MLPTPKSASAAPALEAPELFPLPFCSMAAILLIADAEWVRNDVSAAISDPSTTLTVTDDPDEALRAAQDRAFDLIAVDMQIRSTGGMATVRLFKGAMYADDIDVTPVVLLLDRTADVFLSKRAGADGYLIKPFTAQQLRAVMAELVPEASA